MPKLDNDAADTQLDDQVDVDETQTEDQSTSDQTGDQDGENGQGGNADDNQYFLTVNDRTRYRTQDEAIQAFEQAGQRIAALSNWERTAKQYGISDPEVVAQLFDELLEARTKLAQLTAQPKEGQSAGQPATPATNASDASLSKEEREARAWLQKTFPELGVVTKEQLQKIMERLDGIDQGFQTQRAEQHDLLVEESTGKVAQWMAADKFNDDADKSLQTMIERSITAYINSDPKLVKRWQAGGAALEKVLHEGYDYAKKALSLLRVNSSASYANSKAGAQNRNPRRLPQPGLPPRQGNKQGAGNQQQKKSGEAEWQDAHERAYQAAQAAWGRSKAE